MQSARNKLRMGPFEVELSDSTLVADGLNVSAGNVSASCSSFSLEIETALIPPTTSAKTSSPRDASPRALNKDNKVVNLFESEPEHDGNTKVQGSARSSLKTESCNLPVRDYDCENYATCLGLAAALDWSSFSCKGCCGNLDDQLLWRAHHRVRQNKALQSLCNLPILQSE